MDFKKLISHIESIDGPIDTPKAQEKAQPIRLDEDTELRVLAGVTPLTESIITEKAVSKKQRRFMGMVHATKKGEKPASKAVAKAAKGMSDKEAKKFASTKHKGLPEKKTDSENKKDESIDTQAFKNKFSKMVEAKKKNDGNLANNAKPYDKVTRGDVVAGRLGKDEMGGKNKSKVDEFFYFDGPKKKGQDSGHDELARRQKQGIKTTDPSYKQKDDPRYGGQYKIKGPKGKLPESQSMYKKIVSESAEPKLSFKEMMKLVVESGGQQKMDPVDATLFNWASRIAKNKLGEGMKAEIYAGLVYERMGGRFEMYDVLSENKNKK